MKTLRFVLAAALVAASSLSASAQFFLIEDFEAQLFRHHERAARHRRPGEQHLPGGVRHRLAGQQQPESRLPVE